ncbi:glycerophosphoryl diester phosphodiesterase [Altererythrobacter xiamenensis]|uniref:Glycerophosphoryl diester phosphodiesterase n=1 Tax=Altererythrobacter xiamenensis TaxID=1316679 RepID=A0A1Y6F6E6_9SPHN|nr:glycerophosphodiester phosphodiesterase family protein [Altererythrobacter xiamenensis]SMQ69121.1 glycerophosphoryl diester phosphodiesterase [Altererythrobacter xiamenensis]
MRTWLRRGAFALALVFLILTLVNASWLAPEPAGGPKVIAHRGLYQLYDRTGLERDTCTADRIDPPYHDYLENTLPGILRAQKLGAWMVEVDIAPTADDELVVFHDWTLDCRTDGTGPVREATLEELKALDVGYGYTADGGKTFPFRGEFVGAMPTIEDVASALPRRGRMMINFKSKDAREADLLAAKLKAAGRDPVAAGDAFYGHEAPIARIRELYPEAWSWSMQGAEACSRDYIALGWSSYLPESCRGETMIVPLNRQFAFWGWPNRLIARMEEYGGKVIVVGPLGDNAPRGLTLPEQLGEIPSTFNGYVWVEDAFTIVPALITRFDDRSQAEIDAAQAALERRRDAQ